MDRILMSIHAEDVAFSVLLNGVIIASGDGYHPVDKDTVANLWLNSGNNSCVVYVEAVPPPEAPEPDSDGEVPEPKPREPNIFVRLIESGVPEPEADVYFQYAWPNGEQPGQITPVSTPVEEREFNIDVDGLGPWAWDKAIAYTPEQDQEIAVAAFEIYKAFSEGDISTLMKQSELKIAERAKALGLDPADLGERTKKGYERAINDADLQLIPVPPGDPDMLKIIPMADDRLVLVRQLDNKPFLAHRRIETDGPLIQFDVYLANLPGAGWTWVR